MVALILQKNRARLVTVGYIAYSYRSTRARYGSFVSEELWMKALTHLINYPLKLLSLETILSTRLPRNENRMLLR